MECFVLLLIAIKWSFLHNALMSRVKKTFFKTSSSAAEMLWASFHWHFTSEIVSQNYCKKICVTDTLYSFNFFAVY